MMLFSFKLEVAINSDIKGIVESVQTLETSRVVEILLTTMHQPSPIRPEDSFLDEGMLDILQPTLHLKWH